MNISLIKRLFYNIRPYMGRLILAIFLSVVVGAISTSPVPLIQQTFDKIFVEKDFFMLKVIPLALIGLFFIKGVLLYAQNLIIFWISWDLVVSFRQKLFDHIHSLPFGFFEDMEIGQLISRVTGDVAVMQSTVTRLLKEFVQNGVMLVGLLSWVFYLNWRWALMAFFIFPVIIFPVANIGKKLKRLSHKGQEVMADLCSTLVESFSGIKVVRAFGLEPSEKKKFSDLNQTHLRIMKKNVKYIEIISPLMEFLSIISAATILWYGGGKVMTGEVSQGTFIAFIVALFMIYGPLRILIKNYGSLQIALAGAERVFSILDMEKEKVREGDKELIKFNDGIEFRDVSFSYPSRKGVVLNRINLSVQKGEVLAIVGMSGAGKTTLVDLLFRFHDASKGGIFIDGLDIHEYRLKSLRANLALVTQETFLFDDTIWNNIAFGKEGALEEEIMGAARAAHVDFFVQEMEHGYETRIGERGVKLSGGQKQRIAIARAILRNAPILVLDEATSSLDSASEKIVQDALHNLMEHRTTFVIAHRLSTVKNANRIIVLDKGEIVESGTHESLLANSKLYLKYYEMQFAK